jgi:hypothetical protein
MWRGLNYSVNCPVVKCYWTPSNPPSKSPQFKIFKSRLIVHLHHSGTLHAKFYNYSRSYILLVIVFICQSVSIWQIYNRSTWWSWFFRYYFRGVVIKYIICRLWTRKWRNWCKNHVFCRKNICDLYLIYCILGTHDQELHLHVYDTILLLLTCEHVPLNMFTCHFFTCSLFTLKK